ncbi:NMD protein affecting ribosome stability and mRNA decay [Methanococcoides orientis]|uniref:60S ribosomal export protein NMD3 n=1 Tax=Methanococcoides orientis TaxID=2822137 RepID=UPI001E33E0A6|nr:60S ribosomal export protein NMD3 [Methanococcoides orientis]UGV41347.1 NMD protein affecting ribosome stability and mRNA decay [Methanococcoides orientis]
MSFTLCPKCGAETKRLYKNVCRKCFLEQFTLAVLPLVLHTRICSKCNARFDRNKWRDEGDLEDIAIRTVEDELFIHDEADDVEVSIDPREMTPHLYKVRVGIDAMVEGEPLHQELKAEVRIIREACDRCSRMAGGYFEAILQIRAANRIVTPEEIDSCKLISAEMVEKLWKKGDRFAFITDCIDSKDGADLYLGSANAGRQICKSIVSEIGGTFSESPTLYSHKDGKDLYRITFSMRLPEFMPGDIILFKGDVIEIRNSGKNSKGIYLATGAKFLEETEKLNGAIRIANRDDAVGAVLVAVEGDDIMVLDPSTYQTITLKKPMFFSSESGSEIPVISTEQGLFALPEDSAHRL